MQMSRFGHTFTNGECDPEPNIDFYSNGTLMTYLQWSLKQLQAMDIIDSEFADKHYYTYYNMSEEDKEKVGCLDVYDYMKYYNFIRYTYYHGMPSNKQEVEEYQLNTYIIKKRNKIEIPLSFDLTKNYIQLRLDAI